MFSNDEDDVAVASELRMIWPTDDGALRGVRFDIDRALRIRRRYEAGAYAHGIIATFGQVCCLLWRGEGRYLVVGGISSFSSRASHKSWCRCIGASLAIGIIIKLIMYPI